MTVNELLQKLVELARDGKGQWEVWMCQSLECPVTGLEIDPYYMDGRNIVELQ